MPVSKQQVDKFVQLLENKKTKDALLYLDKINQEDPDPVAQEVVARGLERCLVDKKTTPMGMNSALYVYKQIFVRSLFDFIEIDAFNVKIHKFVYDTCLYNAASKLENRGEKYFEDVMKLELTQQNKMLGSTIVQFALELMQCMAQWYPQCLIQQKPSMYSQYYKKLKEKKVTFPTPQQYQIMKKTDQQKFKKNVDIWIDKVLREMQDEQREQEQKGKTPLPPDPQTLKPINTTPLKNNNSPQFIKYQNDQIMSKIDDSKSGAKRQIGQQKKPAVELKKQLQNDSTTRQSKMPSDNRNLVNEGKKQVSHQSNHEVNDTKLKQVPALKKNISEQGNFILTDPSQIAAVKNIPDNANFILSDPNQLKKMPSIDKKEQPQGINNVPKTMNETKKNINNSNAPTIVKESNEKSKLKIPEPKKEEQDPKVIEARIKMLVDQTLKNSVPDQPVPEGQFSQSYVIKYSKINGNNVQPSNKRVQRKMELPSPSAKKSISPHVHYGKQQVAKMNSGIKKSKEQNLRKSAVRQINTSSVINSRVSEGLAGLVGESKISKFHTPRKNSESDSMKTPIRKIQPDAQQQIKKDPKKQEKREVKKFYKTENKEFYQHAGVRQARHEPAKKRSLPKTERKYLNNVQPFTAAFGNQSPENLKREILNNKTLSDFRNLKNKKRSGNPNIQDYYLREPLLQKIQKLRTREQIIRYLPEYFEPLDTYMEALINESQKIRSNPINQPSRPFLRNQSLQLRLIKLAESYSLSIRNLKQKAINIGYSQALQAKFGDEFSCRIKVKGFERKRVDDVTVWRIQPLEIVDIPFDFSTEDPNFKFLQIILAIDQKINNFYLPITLLDQGIIEKYIDHEQINSFINNNGRVFKSTPICLSLRDDSQHFLDLPAFMSKNSNINSQIIGYMTYQIATNRKQKIKLNIFIKRCEKYSNFYEICSLVDNRSEESIDFSKVIIELLCFLLIKDR